MPGNLVVAVLDQMHTTILQADYAAMDPLVAELELALVEIGQPDQALLQQISRKAMRNAACLQAAGRGIRAALRRVAEVRQTASGLVTYDDTGKRADLRSQGHLTRRI